MQLDANGQIPHQSDLRLIPEAAIERDFNDEIPIFDEIWDGSEIVI